MFKGWKTVTFNVLSALAATLELTGITAMLPEEYHLHYVVVLSAVNFLLRLITDTPVGRKQ